MRCLVQTLQLRIGLQKADDDLQKADGSIKNVVTTLGLINHPDAMHYVQRYFNDCGEADLASINPNQLHHTGYINQLSQILLPVSEGLGFTVLPTSTLNFVSFAEKLAVYQAKNDVTEPLYSVQTPHSTLPARYEIVKKKISQVLGSDSAPTIRN